jgi:hypothetical protein
MAGYGLACWRGDGLLWGGLGCLVIAAAYIAWEPPRDWWGGAPELVIGLLALWQWWRRGGGRDRVAREVGVKSRALVGALVRRVRESASAGSA